MLDIYSRSVVHGLVAPTETAEPAEQFIADAIAAHGGIAPTTAARSARGRRAGERPAHHHVQGPAPGEPRPWRIGKITQAALVLLNHEHNWTMSASHNVIFSY
jgi:hypothetical protein